MSEINVGSRRDAAQQAGRAVADSQTVPSHVRRFHVDGEVAAFAWPERETASVGRLLARCQHPLHAYTNSEKRNVALDAVDYSVAKSGIIQRFGCREMANAGKNQLVCRRNLPWIRSDYGLRAQVIECLLHRSKIAGLVIDDSNHHSNPL